MLLRRRSEKIDLLKEVPLFSGLSRRQLELVARHADQVRCDAGKVLTRQGGLGLEFLLIVDGSARVERDGREIAHLGPGDLFGELSLIDGKPRSATVIAEAPIVLLVIHTRSFGDLLDAIPGLQKKILLALCERLRTADVALASLS